MTSSRIRIHYFTDVLCVWAYLAQVRLDELIKNNASDIEISYHFMPIFGNTEHRIGEGWKDKGSYAAFGQHTRKVCVAYAASHGERTRGLVVPRRRRAVVLSES
jgi:predicted DsbA family dithiol-disulfide isomerase